MSHFPVDRIIPRLIHSLDERSAAIVHAPPGSGKTTRIPLALLDAPWLQGQKIIMLEPRRLAAVNAARWISATIGEEVGGRVGYAIRFDRQISHRTRLEIVTEGLLTRRLQSDPLLDGVGAVIFDEFHERSLHADTALALCLDMQQGLRPDLRILVMSATLNVAGLQTLLPEAEAIACSGTTYPVEIRYLGSPERDPVPAAAAAVNRALGETTGDILLFLPGSGEIRRCSTLLEEQRGDRDFIITPLYGDLPFSEQEAAIRPAARRKIVLATTIAETSLTIEGIRVVIDTGLTRRSRFDPASGLNRLVTERVSASAATQRTGRAGRVAPGICYRLWSEYEQSSLLPNDPPEILISDLAELALNLALWGVHDPSGLTWPDPPPRAAMNGAQRLLQLLGALDGRMMITPLGRTMATIPLHPRLARLLLAGQAKGEGDLACDLAAVISERDFVRSSRTPRATTPCDLADRLELVQQWRSGRLPAAAAAEVDRGALRTVERLATQLRRIIGLAGPPAGYAVGDAGLLAAVAFPDRIAQLREPGSRRYLLASGRGAQLSPRSGVGDARFLVAVHLDGGSGAEGTIFTASSLSGEQVRELFAHVIASGRSVSWDQEAGRVTAREEERLGALVLASRQAKPTRDDAVTAVLEQIRSRQSLEILTITPACRQYQARVGLLRSQYGESDWPDLSDGALLATLDQWLGPLLMATDRPEKRVGIDLAAALRGMLGWKLNARLDELAPTHLVVPSGSRIPLDYAAEDGPVMAVKLQELFGLADTPTVAGGRVAVLLHLLSPAGRPMQVTRDLASFWDRIYPEVKKELKGRYPKHPWPDDPWSAIPTRLTKKRLHGG
jgi:ATP-dependent helicase HrpB